MAGTTTTVNYNPIAFPKIIQLVGLDSITLTLSALAAGGHAVTYTLMDAPALGSLGTLNATTGQVVYTPPPGFSTIDSFSFFVTDGILQSDSATVTVLPPLAPVLTLVGSTGGMFTQGQLGALYSIVVSNSALAIPTAGTVSVTDVLPTGLNLVSMAGDGWACISNVCSRSDALNPGLSYPTINVSVDVSSGAPITVTNQVNISGGGAAAVTINSIIAIAIFTCDINDDGSINVGDVQGIINEALGASAAVNDLTHDGVVNVTDVQKMINAALGLGCAY